MKGKLGSIFFLVLAVVIILSFANVPSALSAQKPVKLKWASVFPPPGLHPVGDYAGWFQKEVTKRTNGAITFQNYWSASLGAPVQHIEFVKQGAVDIVQTHGWYTPSRLPLIDFEYAIPFGIDDPKIAVRANQQIRKEFPQFDKELAAQNAIMIADVVTCPMRLLMKKPVKTLDDLKGTKISIMGRYFGRWLPPGCVAVARPVHERYDLLKTGLVDGDINPADNQYSFKLYEQAQYYVTNVTMMVGIALPILINVNTFNRLAPETQKIFKEVGHEVEIMSGDVIVPAWLDKIFKAWRERGIKFIEFDEQEKLKWIAGLDDIPMEWATEVEKLGLPGLKIVQRWQEIGSEMGYKWPRKWAGKK